MISQRKEGVETIFHEVGDMRAFARQLSGRWHLVVAFGEEEFDFVLPDRKEVIYWLQVAHDIAVKVMRPVKSQDSETVL